MHRFRVASVLESRTALLACSAVALAAMLALPATALAYRQTYVPQARHNTAALIGDFEPYGLAIDMYYQVTIAGNGDSFGRFDRSFTGGTLQGLEGDVFGAGKPMDQACDVSFGDSQLYVADRNQGVVRYDDWGATLTGVHMTGAATSFEDVTSVAADAMGGVFVADHGSLDGYGFRVSKMNALGMYTGVHFGDMGTDSTKWMRSASGVAVASGQAPTVYVADELAGCIWRYTTTTQFGDAYTMATPWKNSAAFPAPVNVSVDDDGFVWVVDGSTNTVSKLTSAGVVLANFDGHGAGYAPFTKPQDVAVYGLSGYAYVADRVTSDVTEMVLQDLGPTTKGYGNLSVHKGKKVTFKYMASDDLSDVVAATIKIYKSGHYKKTISCGSVSQGVWHGKSYTVKLPRGKYTWKVYATDGTGHTARVVGSKTLTAK